MQTRWADQNDDLPSVPQYTSLDTQQKTFIAEEIDTSIESYTQNISHLVRVIGTSVPDQALWNFYKLAPGKVDQVIFTMNNCEYKYQITKTQDGKRGDFAWHIKDGKKIHKRNKSVLEMIIQGTSEKNIIISQAKKVSTEKEIKTPQNIFALLTEDYE